MFQLSRFWFFGLFFLLKCSLSEGSLHPALLKQGTLFGNSSLGAEQGWNLGHLPVASGGSEFNPRVWLLCCPASASSKLWMHQTLDALSKGKSTFLAVQWDKISVQPHLLHSQGNLRSDSPLPQPASLQSNQTKQSYFWVTSLISNFWISVLSRRVHIYLLDTWSWVQYFFVGVAGFSLIIFYFFNLMSQKEVKIVLPCAFSE